MRKKDVKGLRPCGSCGTLLVANREYFYQRKDGYLSSECRTCFRQRSSRNQKARYYAGGVDYHLAYITRNTRQRAKKGGIEYDIDAEFIRTLLEAQEGCCAISRVQLTFAKGEGHIPTNASIDRIDSRKGYTKGNVQLVTCQVNTMKSNLSTTQLAEWCQLILKGLGGGTVRPDSAPRAPDQSL
jgi:hypothetical protein